MAGTAQGWAQDGIADLLREAQVEDRSVSIGAIRERMGLGHEDAEATLDAMRERGDVVEESPGEWRVPYADEAQSVTAAAEEPHEHHAPEEPTLAEARTNGVARWDKAAASGDVETRLTAGMARVIDANAIGQLVLAGIEDAGGRPFVLRIDP